MNAAAKSVPAAAPCAPDSIMAELWQIKRDINREADYNQPLKPSSREVSSADFARGVRQYPANNDFLQYGSEYQLPPRAMFNLPIDGCA
jgi:hypothetical protein